MEAFCIIICDCCREFIEAEEAKGDKGQKPAEGKFIIYTADIGEQATALKNRPSRFSNNMINELHELADSDIDYDLVAYLRHCATKTPPHTDSTGGKIPKLYVLQNGEAKRQPSEQKRKYSGIVYVTIWKRFIMVLDDLKNVSEIIC
eukprot:UN29419